ncbi:hypothetical protein ACQ4PT_033934 [Festuca glaucescens]
MPTAQLGRVPSWSPFASKMMQRGFNPFALTAPCFPIQGAAERLHDCHLCRTFTVLPDPIFTFDIGDTSNYAENYDKCVKKVISMMDEDTDVTYTFVVSGEQVRIPVTPGIDDTPEGTYVIRLVNGDMSLYLVATKYMAWFRGIVTNSGKRYEIVGHRPPKILKRSASMGTTGLYTNLLPGEDIAHVKLGKHRLEWAFYVLAKLGEGVRNDSDEKLALTIIILMFFEGPRFPEVCKVVKKSFSEGDTELGMDNQLQIGDWCDHSRDFYAEKGAERDVHITISDRTSEAVRRIAKKFRIICRSMWDQWKSKNEKGSGGSTSRR